MRGFPNWRRAYHRGTSLSEGQEYSPEAHQPLIESLAPRRRNRFPFPDRLVLRSGGHPARPLRRAWPWPSLKPRADHSIARQRPVASVFDGFHSAAPPGRLATSRSLSEASPPTATHEGPDTAWG